MGARLVDGVFLEYTRTAAAVAKSEYGAVDGEVGLTLVFKFVVMGLAGDVLGGIRQSREGERLVKGLNTESLSLLGTKFYHRAVLVVAGVLRTGVVDVLFADLGVPQSDGTRYFAVWIVIPGASSEVFQVTPFLG